MEKEWQPTPIFLPGEFHGQRSLVGYSPWSCKELDTTEQLTHTHTHTHIHKQLILKSNDLFILEYETSFSVKIYI